MPRVDVGAEDRMLRIVPALLLVIAAAAEADARPRRNPPRPAAAPTRSEAPAPDDLYRRRGYGTGGLLFGNTAQAGACADLAFAEPKNCGPKGGYGLYGNGLGYGF